MLLSLLLAKFVNNSVSLDNRIIRLLEAGEKVSPIASEAEGIKVIQEVCKEVIEPLIPTTISVLLDNEINKEQFNAIAKYYYLVAHLGFKKQLKDKSYKGDRFCGIAKKEYDEDLCYQLILDAIPTIQANGSGKNHVIQTAVRKTYNNMFYYCGKNERNATLEMIMQALSSELDDVKRIFGGKYYTNS